MNIAKKLFRFIYGSLDRIGFKLSFAAFITSVFFCLFAIVHKDNTDTYNFFINVTSISFSLWIVFTKGTDSLIKFIKELMTLYIFLIIFVFSTNYCLTLDLGSKKHEFLIIKAIFSCVGIFLSSIYIVFKLSDIFVFFKRVFKYVYDKLFDTASSSTSTARKIVEYLTTFLVSIGSFFVALQSFIITISQILKEL